ncbi:MAG: GTPase Era [Pseudomonadota bacterium]
MPVQEDKCGFVAVLGAPNAGKSTLINLLVGAKVSIVTPKVQTTRFRILGIALREHVQVILVDTPGIFNPKRRLERAMVKAAWGALRDADIVSVIVDVHRKDLQETLRILDYLQRADKKPILILNKIDLVPGERLLELAAELTKGREIEKTFMISATLGDGVEDFMNFCTQSLPKSPWLYPADQITNLPQRLMAAEITREKVYLYLHQELPYSIAVETDTWETFKNGSIKIHQTIYVQRESQKPIVLGKGGKQIKLIGEKSRQDLSTLLNCPVHLFLHVKVQENWVERPGHYKEVGLDFDA